MNTLRVIFVGGLTSYRALFNWISPWIFVPHTLGYPIFEILFFAYLGRFAGVESDRFFLIDLSSLGTTLNGRHVPKGYDEVDGAKRENGAETPLPDSARIGLADTVLVEFQKVS